MASGRVLQCVRDVYRANPGLYQQVSVKAPENEMDRYDLQRRGMEEQVRYRWKKKLERDDGVGLAIHSEIKATASQRRHWTEISRARDREKDQEAVGEE